jgi:hypothetical protein
VMRPRALRTRAGHRRTAQDSDWLFRLLSFALPKTALLVQSSLAEEPCSGPRLLILFRRGFLFVFLIFKNFFFGGGEGWEGIVEEPSCYIGR